MSSLSKDEIKRAVGKKAASLVKQGMLVGIGTGSTAHYFIQHLIELCKDGLKITAIATSEQSASMAKSGGIPVLEMEGFTRIDLTIDGADEIDPFKRLIKGGGGALVREKIVASSSTEMVVIADESKLVKHLGAFGLPVEILRFGCSATITKLYQEGFKGELRKAKDGSIYLTDNGNYIFDVHYQPVCKNPESDHVTIRNITGVVDTGFFINIAGRVILGSNNGDVEIYDTLPQSLPFS